MAPLMSLDLWTALTILSMGAVTYAIRAGGYWLFKRMPPSPAVKTMLSYVPGTLFVSFVFPAVASGGLKEWVGAAVAAALVMLTGNMTWPIFAGTAAAWIVWLMI